VADLRIFVTEGDVGEAFCFFGNKAIESFLGHFPEGFSLSWPAALTFGQLDLAEPLELVFENIERVPCLSAFSRNAHDIGWKVV
jgi:hypothetical protein